MTVLVVDDSEAVASIMARIATQGGWNALYTVTTDEALAILRAQKVDLLLLDYIMPDKSGLEFAQYLRSHGWPSLPIFLFSGQVDLIDTAEAAKAGISRIFQKPLSIAELRAAMNETRNQIPKQG
jgi:DNA-binding response OmpR family regulator